MKPIYRKFALSAALAVAGLELAAPSAQAQPNTYADFPFQQGSLFYQYRPQNRPNRQVARPVYTTPAQPGTVYRPAAPGTTVYRPAATGTYVQPQQGYYYTQPRRGLFGRWRNR
jgi:hypothetical protein